MGCEEYHDIVIVGGGICGLATALGLHRKGIRSLVLERSDILRAGGAGIGIFLNGWLALDQLGVGSDLRGKANPISEFRHVWLDKGDVRVTPCREEELWFLKRSDLIETLANSLPAEYIRFGCQVLAVETDSITSFPILHTANGGIIKTKVLIGCDGSSSLVAKSLGLEATKPYAHRSMQGFTTYPKGHNFGSDFLRTIKGGIVFGRIPMNDKSILWYVGQRIPPTESSVERDAKHIKERALNLLQEFPEQASDMVEQCDMDLLVHYQVRYKSPWKLMLENFSRGTTTVAGDALHAMGPFIGQGGSASLEDAVVLAGCLAAATANSGVSDEQLKKRVGIALHKYSRERKLRVVRLALQSYLEGHAMLAPQGIKLLLAVAMLIALFGRRGSLGYALFDCGRL